MRALPARTVALGLLVAAVALVVPAAGQEPSPTPRGGRVIEALLIWRLVDELDLSEVQIARVFPVMKALKGIRMEMGRRAPRLMREIRHLSAQQPRDEELIRAKVSELNALRADAEAKRRGQLQAIGAVLTPEQMAKFAIIQETFEHDTLRLLEEIRRIAEGQTPRR